MSSNSTQCFKFPISKDQYLVLSKTDLIFELYKNFKISMSPDNIKILRDGLELQITFGVDNKTINTGDFKRLVDFFTAYGIEKIKYDEQVLKLWIEADSEFLFVDSGDDRLQTIQGGKDAPSGTVQVQVKESTSDKTTIYTVVYSDSKHSNKAILESLLLCNRTLGVRQLMNNTQIDDFKISLIRKHTGERNRIYNDKLPKMIKPIIEKVIFHV